MSYLADNLNCSYKFGWKVCYWIFWNLKLIILSTSIMPLPNFNFKFHMHILHATVCKPIDFWGQISKGVLFADFYAFT